MARLKYEDVEQEVKDSGWQLLSTTYINLKTEMTFECPNGHQVFVPWEKLRTRRDCPICKQTTF